MKYLEKEEEIKEIIKKELVLIDFYAEWCGPCQLMAEELEQLSKENDKVEIIKIDVDKFQKLAMEYGIMSIPTIIIYKNGKETNKNIGYLSKEEIKNLLM